MRSLLTQLQRGEGNSNNNNSPLTGGGFGGWTDRLRNVEELLEDPGRRDQAARVREQARDMRIDFKRHGKEPKWDMVIEDIVEPLVEMQAWLAEQMAQIESKEALVPIDRDPVPDRFSELVRRYYERLGSDEP